MRWWGWVLSGAGLSMAVLGVWLYLGGPFRAYKPDGPFDASRVPAALDYSDDAAWLALPSKREESDLVPEGDTLGPPEARDVAAVFFIHPTSYGGKTWNAGPMPGSRSQEFLERILAAEASAFNAAGPVYAPHYRQATLYAFITRGQDGIDALQLAYGDVARAFDAFLDRVGERVPFLIVSHSQGTLHAYRLLAERVDPDPDLRARLVAAYTIGFPLPREGLQSRFAHIPVCDGEDQTGCLITFGAWAEGTEPYWDPYVWDGDVLKRQDEGVPRVCVNPLSWRDDRVRAEATLHQGALVMPPVPEDHFTSGPNHSGQRIESLAALLPEHTRATCGPQALHIEEQSDPPYSEFITDGCYHPHDIAIFYGNLRENARVRARKWHEARRTELWRARQAEAAEAAAREAAPTSDGTGSASAEPTATP